VDKESIALLTTIFAIVCMVVSLMISAIAIDKANKALFEAKKQRVQVQQIRDKFFCDKEWRL